MKRWVLLLHRRRLSSHHPVDHSFTSNHVAPDGRVFQFATVITTIPQHQSALPAWEHACSLVGANPPTLAVAFLSKPTHSALAALREFAHQFSRSSNVSSSATAQDSQHNASKQAAESHSHSARTSIAVADPVGYDHQSGRSMPPPKPEFPITSPPIEYHRARMPPLIGCVAFEHDRIALTTSILGSNVEDLEDDLIWMGETDEKGDGPNQGAAGGERERRKDEKTGLAGGTSGVSRTEARRDSVQLGQVSLNEMASTEDEGTFADWEELIREYDHLKVESEVSDDANGDDVNECLASGVELDFILQEEFPGKRDAKEALTSFWNHFAQSDPALHSCKSAKRESMAVSHSRAFLESVFRQPRQQQGNPVKFRKPEYSPFASQSQRTIAHGGEHLLKDDEGLLRNRGGDILASNLDCFFEAPTQSYVTKNNFQDGVQITAGENEKPTQSGQRHIRKDDGSYQLTLCVGNMPGVQVTSFYTRTTGLPWLPDLLSAVTVNNPHMLLLGAPGFDLLEFTQRLVRMFPNGSRAGASLLDVDEGKAEGSMDDEAAKIFYGVKHASVGAVGLSMSSSEGAGSVPVDAFAEFVRMSLGMPRGSCWNTFLDEAICESLFYPRNTTVEWLDAFQNAYRVDPESVLHKLHAKLHKKCDRLPHTEPVKTINEEELFAIDGWKDDVNLSSMGPTSAGQCQTESRVIRQPGKTLEMERLCIISVEKVLFPGFFIPLMIENPCDRLMVRHCLEQRKPFGVSGLFIKDSLDSINCKDIVGTIANMKVSLFERDFKSYIIAHGVRRFRVINRRSDAQPGTFGQLVGQVELFDDLQCGNVDEKEEVMELAKKAVGLCQQLFPSAAAVLGAERSFQDPIVASFAVSHILPVSAQLKRRWLSMVDTKYRLKEQITFLNT